MSTGLAPPTIPSVETGTPPKEWSQSILASNHVTDTPATLSEIQRRAGDPNMTAEGSRVESQAPKKLEKEQAQPNTKGSKPSATTGDQPSTGEKVVPTARQYVPEQVGEIVEYATQAAAAAASYLPIPQGIKDTVSSYLPSEENKEGPHVSMPSTELRGAQPSEHTGGVGALPGNLSESSVALLPDERQERAQDRRPTSPRQRRDTIKPSTTGGGDEPRESQKKAEAKMPRDAALVKGETVASQQSANNVEARAAETVESNRAGTFGPAVGSQEASETKNQETLSRQDKTAVVAGEKEKGIKGSNLASEKHGNGEPHPSQDVQGGGNEEGRTTTAGKVEGGYGGEYHPAQLHPPPPGASVAEHQASTGAQQQGQDLPASTGKRASMGAEKKPGFMTMVKGEMKIIAGKMSGDEHKVEEGKKLVHGDV